MDIVGVIAVVALIVGIAASLVTVATFFYQVPQARQRFLRHRRLVIVISLLLALIGAGIYVAGPTHVDEFKLQPFGGRPQHLVTLPDGSVWFTDANGNRIEDASAEGALTRYVVQYQDSMPIGITIGPDNNLWIAEEKGARIEVKDRSGNTITTIPIPFKDSRPQFITLGPDRNLWFTDHGTHSIGRVKIDVLPVTRASIFVVDEYSRDLPPIRWPSPLVWMIICGSPTPGAALLVASILTPRQLTSKSSQWTREARPVASRPMTMGISGSRRRTATASAALIRMKSYR